MTRAQLMSEQHQSHSAAAPLPGTASSLLCIYRRSLTAPNLFIVTYFLYQWIASPLSPPGGTANVFTAQVLQVICV